MEATNIIIFIVSFTVSAFLWPFVYYGALFLWDMTIGDWLSERHLRKISSEMARRYEESKRAS